MKEQAEPSSTNAGRADEAPARILLYCFHCRHTFEGILPARGTRVNPGGENSAGPTRAALPPCPLCRRTSDLYRVHRL